LDIRDLTIALLKSQLRGKSEALAAMPKPTEEELTRVFRLSAKHDLAHMTGAAMAELGWLTPSSALQLAVEQQRIKALYRYTRLWHGYEEICRFFEQEGIPYLPLKGAYMRHLYPTPEMRTSCDIDILVPEELCESTAAKLCEQHGFTQTGKTYHDIALVQGDAVHLELHYNVKEDLDAVDPVLCRVWEYTVPVENSTRRAMTPAFFAFHLVSHACEHFLRGGCGIRPVMDLYLLCHSESFDREGTRALCAECGIAVFFDQLCALAEVWFGEGTHTPVTREMQDFILKGGAYGTKEGKVAISASNKKSGKLRYALSRIFVSRKLLARGYPIVDKHPILIPLFQVLRWFRVLRRGNGGSAVRELSMTANLSQEQKQAMSALLDQLEL